MNVDRRMARRLLGGAGFLVALFALVVMLRPGVVLARLGLDSFADLTDKLLPAVVNISTSQVLESQQGGEMPMVPPGSPFEEFFKEFFDRGQTPQQRRRRATSLGSGFIINPSGHIVTNNHVIQDADEITVILQDETRLPAQVVGRDVKTDIAVLKVEPPTKLTAVSFGDSSKVRVGDWIIAIGNPFGLGGTVTAGIISGRSRDIQAGPYDDFLQTDASINRGNSGGPMFNLSGEVIGINTAIISPTGGSIGLGFAIPSNDAQLVIKQLIEFGEVRRGWLGVRIQTVTDELAESFGLKESAGALVAEVIAGGPAEQAKIQKGDVITEFDGKKISDMRRLPRIVAETEVGRSVPIKVWRDRKELTLRVAVGALDEGEEKVAAKKTDKSKGVGSRTIDKLGMTVAGIDDKVRQRFELPEDAEGVVVTEVEPTGAAGSKGIRPGDLIVEVAQQEVRSPDDVDAKIEQAVTSGQKSILLLIEGQGGLRFVAVRLDKS